MKTNKLLLGLFLLLPAYCTYAQYQLKTAFPKLSFQSLLELASPNDNSNRLFAVSKVGTIHVFANDSTAATSKMFLTIGSKIVTASEMGLLGLAFHPNYASNGYFYVHYNRVSSGTFPYETVIARFQVSATDPDQANPGSELILLTFGQPFGNHKGGKIEFGNDGYLYIATGDGGGGGDPQNNAQNRTNLLGKMLRIDVNTTAGGLNYAIPADNPYANNTEGFRKEIFAYGLRNPWKFSVDRKTGRIWIGDVGQGAREEVDTLQKGGNFGWRMMEGNACYSPSTNCNPGSLILPIFDYDRGAAGGKSITGGYVYRGLSLPPLLGKYIYGDYISENIWALTTSENGTVTNELLLDSAGNITSFAEDAKKNLYVCLFNGQIKKLINPSITITSTAEMTSQSVEVYPNPSSEVFHVRLKGFKNYGTTILSLYNSLGQLFSQQTLNRTDHTRQVTIPVAGFPRGAYFLRVQFGKYVVKRLVMIQ